MAEGLCRSRLVGDQDLAAESRGVSDIEPVPELPKRGWTRLVQRDQ